MAQRYFFSHLIDVSSVHIKLNELDLTDEEKSELLHLAHDRLHYVIIDIILSELSKEDKKIFLRQMSMNDQAGLWRFLNRKVERVEDKIKEAASDVIKELHEDIEHSKKLQKAEA